MTKKIILAIILSVAFSFGNNWPHCPWPHNHDSQSECFGYAMARAFGKGADGTCSAKTMSGEGIINSVFYSYTFNWNNIKQGDILTWANHAVYVIDPGSKTKNTVYVGHRENEGGEIHDIGYENPAVYMSHSSLAMYFDTYGDPSFIRRKKHDWKIKVENSFGSGDIEVNQQSVSSGSIVENLRWNSNVSLDAIEDGELNNGYVRIFYNWSKSNYDVNEGPYSFKSPTVIIKENILRIPVWTANFNKEFNVRFENGFVGSSAPDGDMEIDGNLVEDISFNDVFYVEQEGDIEAEVINHQNHNGITYIFDNWSDGVQSENRTIIPTDHENYTALFHGRPHQVSNLRVTSGYYEPITIAWNRHQNNYCKYRIYRRVRRNGSTTNSLIATLNNNVTSYTDIEYARTPGYTDCLVSYDARAFYTIESTEAVPYFLATFGIEFMKQGKDSTQNETETPTEYILSNYPNPFNPTTVINYSVLENSSVNISIYNIAGKLVKSLKNTELPAGYYSLVWDGTDNNGSQVSSGVYFIKSHIGTNMMTKKIMLMQ